MHPGPGQQFGDDFLVDVGVLPHVQAGKVETEDPHRFPQPSQPVLGEQSASVDAQRGVDDVEVGEQLSGCGVGGQPQVEFVLGLAVQDVAGRRGEPAVDTAQCAAVGLVGAGRFAAHIGECHQFLGDLDQPGRHRQLFLQGGQLAEVVREGGIGGATGGQPDHLGGDVGVTVAVATDPRARTQDRLRQQLGVGPARLQSRADLGVDLRDDLQEC